SPKLHGMAGPPHQTRSQQRAASRPVLGRRAGHACGEPLSPVAARWCAELPADARPEVLASRFPAVVNRIAQAWHEAARARELLEDLLIDQRGDRSGFPKDAFGELLRLHRLISATGYDTRPQDVWSGD
ncbi:MAG TPA: hypothetical protein VJN68_14150, partial [Burkholderiaceae bacterium]|nr:hypothetical protein [Burkholderiaceae bacterium]